MKPFIMLNGQPIEGAQVTLASALLSQGTLFGRAATDIWRTYRGIASDEEAHIQRLAQTVDHLGLKEVWDADRLSKRIQEARHLFGAPEVTIKVIVSATSDTLLSPSQAWTFEHFLPWELIYLRSIPMFEPQASPERITMKTIKTACAQGVDTHKTTSYWSRIWSLRDRVETLWVDSEGMVLEGATSNVFAIYQGRVITPPLALPILPGIVRNRIISLCKVNAIPLDEHALPISQCYKAEALWITSSIQGMRLVTHLDGQPIGSEDPPVWVHKIHDWLQSNCGIHPAR